MKIENINVEEFLKSSFVVNREESKKISERKMPSFRKKHVKNKKKAQRALNQLIVDDKSWYEEVKVRYADSMDKEMVFYRGNIKTGREVFEEADMLANTLNLKGIRKGDEIIACMSNVPEVLTLLLAASKCGAVVNFIGAGFDKEFIKEIVNSNKEKKLFIGTDDSYGEISDIIESAGFRNKVLVSLTNSLKDGIDPYEEYDNSFYKFKNRVPEYQKNDPEIMEFNEYVTLGKNHKVTFEKVGLEDDFTITYTSGSTKIGWPKAIVHKNKTYLAIARFHDPDLSRMPAMRNMRGLAHIPTHSNTNIASSISDTLCQKCSVAFEPIYHKDFFAYSLDINQPGFAPATRSFWLQAIHRFREDERLIGKKLSQAVNYVAVGEDISKNEIKYIDEGFKELKAGSKVLPKPLSPITLSVGGGCCEIGGLLFTLFKSLREKVSPFPTTRKEYGLRPFQLADVAILNEDGTECGYNEVGNLVVNSCCTMKEYKDNKEATEDFYIKDSNDRTWANVNVWAYIGSNGNVVMKGRKDSNIELSTGKKIPNYLIADSILDSDERLLSCEVITKKLPGNDIAVAHIQLLPEYDDNLEIQKQTIKKIDETCYQRFSTELADHIVYRLHTRNNPFYLTKSGKRSIPVLEEEPLINTMKPGTYDDNFVNGATVLASVENRYYPKKYIKVK